MWSVQNGIVHVRMILDYYWNDAPDLLVKQFRLFASSGHVFNFGMIDVAYNPSLSSRGEPCPYVATSVVLHES